MTAVALAAFPAPALSQVAPKSPVHVTTNAVFLLCPALVRSNTAPSGDFLEKLGLQPNSASTAQAFEFKAIDPKGALVVNYDIATQRCTLNYTGPGYEQISGVVRDLVARNKLVRITGGDKDGAKADVYEGPVPSNTGSIARFIIIENYAQPSAAISYTERAKS